MSFDKVYVLDTNIILNDVSNIINISQNGQNLIVLPETVIDEIDIKKTGFEEINYQAREFGRFLSDSEIISSKKLDKSNIVRLKIDNIIIDIISLHNYSTLDVDKKVINDRKIIEVAKYASEYYSTAYDILNTDTILLSLDVMCRIRSISLDIVTQPLDFKKKEKDYNFIKELPINSNYINGLNNKNIIDYDPDYKTENYCYKFIGDTGHIVLAYILNGKINIIDENELRKHTIKPKNSGQLYAMAGMSNPLFSVCLIDALAGSGKTLLAIATGMRCIDKGQYNKIIYIRNSIESLDKGEDVGYLSGNDEKFRIYNMPLFDTLEFIARQMSKDNKETQESIESKIDELKAKYQIETTWVGEMRGRTLSNAFVIIDEVQNMSRKTVQLILTRLDNDCKVVCIGSNRQIDNQWVNKYTNGLSLLLDEAENDQPELNMFATKLDRVVRGKITEWSERVFSKK